VLFKIWIDRLTYFIAPLNWTKCYGNVPMKFSVSSEYSVQFTSVRHVSV